MYLRNPGISNQDLSVHKNFRFGEEGRYLQFRMESFNVFNHSQFSGRNLTSSVTASTLTPSRSSKSATNPAKSNSVPPFSMSTPCFSASSRIAGGFVFRCTSRSTCKR